MPSDQRVGLDDDESIPPVEHMQESSQGKANGIGGTTRLDLSLDKKAELLSQKEILRCNGSPGLKAHPYKGRSIQQNCQDGSDCVRKRLHALILPSR